MYPAHYTQLSKMVVYYMFDEKYLCPLTYFVELKVTREVQTLAQWCMFVCVCVFKRTIR